MTRATAKGSRARVLFLNSCINGGGAGRSLQAYLKVIDPRIEAHVVMPSPGILAPGLENVERIWYVPEFVERPQRSNYALAGRLGWEWFHWASNVYGLPRSAGKIARIAREIGADLIYCNHMLANPIGAVAGARAGVPVVFHARNIHVAPVGRAFYRYLAQRACVTRLICNSRASAELFLACEPAKVRIVHNFVDLERFDRARIAPTLRRDFGIPGDAVVVGYVGRLVPKKGLPVLLEAFRQLAERFPRAHLVLLGGNDTGFHRDLGAEYRALAERSGIGGRTHFTGFLDDVRPVLADFDVLALPSVEPESFGRVLIEAMALGIPCVVSRLGGALEVVDDGRTGFWATPGDAADLADKLGRLVGDATLRERFGRDGQEGVRARFASRALGRQISDVLLEAAGRGLAEGDRAQAALVQPREDRR
ncbi:MAG TPA: glycosyltransferase family 4 protein [bacterium]